MSTTIVPAPEPRNVLNRELAPAILLFQRLRPDVEEWQFHHAIFAIGNAIICFLQANQLDEVTLHLGDKVTLKAANLKLDEIHLVMRMMEYAELEESEAIVLLRETMEAVYHDASMRNLFPGLKFLGCPTIWTLRIRRLPPM
jgi:hypothetical protein